MKFRNALLIVFFIILLDQTLKFYIKLNFFYQQDFPVLGQWFKLFFIENEGMAFGMNFGGKWGKLGLTLFRLVAVIWGAFFIKNTLVKEQYPKGLVACSSLILAGALGNLIDSMFYGKIFTNS